MEYRPYRQAILERVAISYACSRLLDDVIAKYSSRVSDDDIGLNRLLALSKVFASAHGLHVTSTCRERLGAQGLFCANRVVTYWVCINGIVTAEGDNEVITIRAARELLLGEAYEAPAHVSQSELIPMLESAEFLIWLVREHESTSRQSLLDSIAIATQTASLFDAWNEHAADAIRLAKLHTARLALESMNRRLDEQEDARTRAISDRLLRLFALHEIEGFSIPLMVNGLIDYELAASVASERRRLVQELADDAELLVDAFGIPSSLLDAPIGDDYVAAYERMASTVPPRVTFIRGMGETLDRNLGS
jgi:acyl-CoA oxidase